ncbi:MAG: hypothetical protein A3K05_01465 [Candidatus Doudnabacteria bacterium RIFCSPHIGHO2_01_48_18]|nr:MAG: hypothetical protein A3K05_01465 [Candidatus Doudnabacteria bacterium RIFCSPHIGHO2_01_48_18]
MAKKRKIKVRGGEELPEFHLSQGLKRGILIVVFLALAVISFLAFFDQAGKFGELLNKIFGLLFGQAALVLPLIFFSLALAIFFAARRNTDGEENEESDLQIYIGGGVLTVALTGLLHLLAMRGNPNSGFDLVKMGAEGQYVGGGYIGVLSALPLYRFLDFWPTLSIYVAGIVISLILIFDINLANLFKRKEREEKEPLGKKLQREIMQEIKINKMQTAGFTTSKVNTAPAADMGEEDRPAIKVNKPGDIPANSAVAAALAGGTLLTKFKKGNWQLPPLDLLEDSHTEVDSGNIEANVTIIQKTLSDFGIEVEMGEVNVGPTVTQYTLRPAQGIKLSQIAALQNDLALALAASSVRMELPIPGKALVGIEIPNRSTAIVRVKDVISTDKFAGHKSNLAFALGRDVAGHPIIADLAAMPHLLIAGATGTGKSVGINALMISLLYRNSPEELRMIVIDPKRVELNLYNGIPHLLTPVVIDHDKAVNALKWAVAEMDRRYNLLAEAKKRNILEYNSKAENKLPYIVIVVDELADLMAVAQQDVEAAIVRLAQMARAVGVHLVVATQRPSVDIITGLIKANITARMAFAVASQVDSRTILDASGAEKLLGSGDMLYITAELGKPKRVQGSYISEREVKNVVEFVAGQAGEVEYSPEILEKQRPGTALGGSWADDEDGDDMLEEAVDVVKTAGKASASLLQRRLRIGYARAARLLDLMEEKGLIGPADGAKPRDVYVAGAEADGVQREEGYGHDEEGEGT